MPGSFRKAIALFTIAAMTLSVGAPAARAGMQVGVSAQVGAASDPWDSAVTGAAVGAAGGPIGLVIGAGLGLLYGLWAQRRQDEQARAEAERQRAMDRELERQMAGQRPGGPPAPAGEGQGVIFVKDHLASLPAEAAKEPSLAGDAAVDAEGFTRVYDGGRLVRREHRTPQGTLDVVLHYDSSGRLTRRDESSRLDGRLDISMFYGDGALQRKESDTDGDGQPDVWADYDGAGELIRFESLVAGGGRRAEHYRDGRVSERLEGDLLSVFDDTGRIVKQGRKGQGDRMLSWRYFEADGKLAREEEFGEDGQLIAVAHYEAGRLVRRELYVIDEGAFTRVPVIAADREGS